MIIIKNEHLADTRNRHKPAVRDVSISVQQLDRMLAWDPHEAKKDLVTGKAP